MFVMLQKRAGKRYNIQVVLGQPVPSTLKLGMYGYGEYDQIRIVYISYKCILHSFIIIVQIFILYIWNNYYDGYDLHILK